MTEDDRQHFILLQAGHQEDYDFARWATLSAGLRSSPRALQRFAARRSKATRVLLGIEEEEGTP